MSSSANSGKAPLPADGGKPAPAPKLGSPAARVLVVDDESVVLTFLRRALTQWRYQVDTAANGAEAIVLLGKNTYDLVLTDVNLPGASGTDVLTECKRRHPDTEVVLITGKPELEDAVTSIKGGAFDYLAKPIELERLREKVKAAIARRRSHAEVVERTVAMGPEAPPGFRILRRLGAGSMGVVLLVERDGTSYAMKVLRSRATDPLGDTSFQRFLREGEVLRSLNHPGIVKVFDYGVDANRDLPYILMEYVPGLPLSQYVGEYALSLSQKLSIIRQIAEALHAVHSHGILHRDVKPSNVLVTDKLQTKLTDFGIARLADSSLTMPGEILGSPAYMAPERFGSPDVDHQADIFSLGVLSFELVAGCRPFVGDTFTDLMRTITTTAPLDLRALVPGLPDSLVSTILGMLEKDPRKRLQTGAEVAAAVDRLARAISLETTQVMR